jgi:hypothetical protein
MDLKTLDPRITLKLLEGREDVITPLAQEREQFYKSKSCPRCGGNANTKTGDFHRLFVDGEALPRYQLRCDNCACLFDPFSGIVIEMGNLGKAFVPAIPILPGPED